jgi:casein kinase II subunit beta
MSDGSEHASQEVEEEEALDAGKNSEEGEAANESGSELTASENEESWVSWFVNLRGHDFFCEVDEDYIQDDFNLTGLGAVVPYYDYALDMMLDVEVSMDSLTEEQQELVESATAVLYGLIHARYILTSRGMQRMVSLSSSGLPTTPSLPRLTSRLPPHKQYEKYQAMDFGRCPRVFCQGQPVLPIGLSDLPQNYTVNVFCPRCHEIFHPKSSKQGSLDGAYFGTTFAHLFLLSHPELVMPKAQQTYIPRIYGFKIHPESVYHKLRNREDPSGREQKSKKPEITSRGEF